MHKHTYVSAHTIAIAHIPATMMDIVNGVKSTHADDEKKRLSNEIITQRDIVTVIAQHMGVDAVGKLAGLCEASNKFVNLTRADIGGFIREFGDPEMRRQYTDRLIRRDLQTYNFD